MITNLRESVRENLINLNNETFAYIEDNDIKRLKEIKCIADNLEIMIFPVRKIEEQLYDGISALIKNVDSVILGCTELSILKPKPINKKIYDSVELLAIYLNQNFKGNS